MVDSIVLERLKPETMSPEVRALYDTTTNYLRKNMQRMNYPEYLRRGWQIASGGIELACKTIVNQLLCLGGTRGERRGRRAERHQPPGFREASAEKSGCFRTSARQKNQAARREPPGYHLKIRQFQSLSDVDRLTPGDYPCATLFGWFS